MDKKDLEGFQIEMRKKNLCPSCNSKRISQINTYQVWEEENLSSGNILSKNTHLTPLARVFHSYICRKCGWRSINFDE